LNQGQLAYSFIYLIQAAWPIKHKNTYTYTKHKNAKLKEEEKRKYKLQP